MYCALSFSCRPPPCHTIGRISTADSSQSLVSNSEAFAQAFKLLQKLPILVLNLMCKTLHFFKAFDGLAARGLASLCSLAFPEITSSEKM
jgi:hypothetical protein